MACERHRETLSDLAAGGAGRAGTAEHLAACPTCRAELVALRRAIGMAEAGLAEVLSAEPSPAFRARLRAAVEAEGARGASWMAPRLRWLSAAALVLAAGALAVLWHAALGREARVPAEAVLQPGGSRPGSPGVVVPAPAPIEPMHVARGPAPGQSDRRREAARQASAPASGRAAPATEPEVLVPSGQEEALLLFAAALHDRVVTQDSLLVADVLAPLREPDPVRIPPIEIGPLDGARPSDL